MNQNFVWYAVGHTIHSSLCASGKHVVKSDFKRIYPLWYGREVPYLTGLEIRPLTEVPIFYSVPPLKYRSITCLHSFFWVIPRRLNLMCRRFGTICVFHRHRWCEQEEPCSHHLWRWQWQSFPKRRHIKFRCRGITQKKECNIQNTAKVWNPVLPVCSIYFKFLIHSDFAILH